MLSRTVCTRVAMMALFILAAVALPAFAQTEFDQGFLRDVPVDISRVVKRRAFSAGSHRLDVYLNDRFVARMNIDFVATDGEDSTVPCVNRRLLDHFDVDERALGVLGLAMPEQATACIPLSKQAGFTAAADFADLSLRLSLPQAILRQDPRGYVNPREWDSGGNVAMLSYNASLYRSVQRGQQAWYQGYLGLDSGANVGGLQFRQRGSLGMSNRGRSKYQSVAAYLQHNLASLRSQFVLGDTSSAGELFDSTPIRGMRLYSDERMLPQSQRGYAPQIRGVALSNARVEVLQNGIKLYETTVPPGPFVIDDLYPMGYGGELKVVINEANGEIRNFSVPYAGIPQLLRPGRWQYALTSGRLRQDQGIWLTEATLHHGLSNAWTGYGGIQLSRDFRAYAAGVSVNTAVGAISLDGTHSRAQVNARQMERGVSVRLAYSHLLTRSNTSIYLASQRYSTRHYWSLSDFATENAMRSDLAQYGAVDRPRSKLSLTLSQPFPAGKGLLSASVLSTQYWNERRETGYQWNYANTVGTVAYNVALSKQSMQYGRGGYMLNVGINIPLGARSNSISMQMTRDRLGGSRQQIGVSGPAREDSPMSYSVGMQRANADERQISGSGSIAYRTSYADANASLSAAADYSQASFGIRGGAVAHAGGVTFSQALSDTFAIVEAKGASGMKVGQGGDIRIDSRGYAIVPYLTPFERNNIELNPMGSSLDIQLSSTMQQVVPVAGAVPKVVFQSRRARSFLIRARKENGQFLPFGALIEDELGHEQGIIGASGRILAQTEQASGNLTASWGGEACILHYQLPPAETIRSRQLLQLDLVCKPAADTARMTRSTEATVSSVLQ